MLDRLLNLTKYAPDDGAGAGAAGTSTTDGGAGAGDAGAKAAADKAAADAAAAKAKDGGAGERKTVLQGDDGKAKDGQGDAGAKDAGAKAKDGAADDYVVKLPEGMKEGEVDKAQLSDFTKWAKEKGLKSEQATEALAYWKTLQENQAKAWAKQDQDWYGELEKDAEFGGNNLKANSAALQAALKKFDPTGDLAKDLGKYGLENLPSLAKFLARVGKAGAEDKSQADKDGKGTAKKLTAEERRKRFYDDTVPPEKTT